jgi:hypothetical protein
MAQIYLEARVALDAFGHRYQAVEWQLIHLLTGPA